jgi:hypothetical protein
MVVDKRIKNWKMFGRKLSCLCCRHYCFQNSRCALSRARYELDSLETHWLKGVFGNREVTRMVSYFEDRFEIGPVRKFC